MSSHSGTTALVTGATGFIGSHLARRLLRDGFRVHVWTRSARTLAWRLEDIWPELSVHEVDLLDADLVRRSLGEIRPALVFHLASYRKVERNPIHLKTAIAINLEGTLHLLAGLVENGASLRVMVNTGSSEEYGSGPAPLREDLRESPVSPYSASKVAATHLGGMLYRSFGLPVVTLRPFLTYGPAQDPDMFVPSLIEHCIKRQDFPMTAGDQLREFNYVSDIVEGFLLASQRPEAIGQIINVGNGEAYSLARVADLIVEKMGHPIRLLKGALPKRPGESALYCDNTKARDLLGWRPRIGLEEGLSRTIEWYVRHRESRSAD